MQASNASDTTQCYITYRIRPASRTCLASASPSEPATNIHVLYVDAVCLHIHPPSPHVAVDALEQITLQPHVFHSLTTQVLYGIPYVNATAMGTHPTIIGQRNASKACTWRRSICLCSCWRRSCRWCICRPRICRRRSASVGGASALLARLPRSSPPRRR